MIYKLVIDGRLPGLNNYTAAANAHWAVGAKLKKDTEEAIGWYILSQLAGVKIATKVRIDFHWFEANMKRDQDNIAFAKKFIQDALVKMGVLQGDGWRYVKGLSDDFDIDKAAPRIEVLITEILGV